MKQVLRLILSILISVMEVYGAAYVGFTQPPDGYEITGNGNGGGNWVTTNMTYTMSGWMYAYDNNGYQTVTNVTILRDGVKLGDATLSNPSSYGSWTYEWNSVMYGSNTLQAIAYSSSGNGTATVSGTFTATNSIPIAYDITNTVVEGGSVYIYPFFQDSDSGQSNAAIIVSSPSKGTVLSYGRYFYYTSDPGFPGHDSFTYKVNDGFDDSNIATVTITIQTNTPPIAYGIHATINVNTNNQTIAASFIDPDYAQTVVAIVVDGPEHGTVSTVGTTLRYTPTSAYIGPDTFTYKVNDGIENSNVARCQLLVRPPDNPSGALITLIINSNLFVSAISNEVIRLKTDLENEGYAAKIKLWNQSGGSRNQYSSNLWTYLRSEYDKTNQFLEGAIFIGDLPKAQTYAYHPYYNATNWYYTDLIYWNMSFYQTNNEITTCNIWVSRINADDTAWGAQDILIRRALDANHNYRTGASRLPFTAFVFSCFTTNPPSTTMLDVWPAVRVGGGGNHNAQFKFMPERTDLHYAACDAFVAGGEVFNEVSHGSASGYMEGSWFDENALYRVIAQNRVALIGSCTSGAFGGIANNHIFTRGGGCVIAVSGTDINYDGDFQINGAYGNEPVFRRRLAAGDSWGGACLHSYPFNNYYTGNRIVFYGDFSLKAMASIQSNTMPQIASYTIVTNAWNSYTFTVSATDPDGTISYIEWFCNGYNYGKNTPTNTGISATLDYTYASAGTYTCRVEIIDNYLARDWREIIFTVNRPPTPSHDTVTVEAGQSVLIPVLDNDTDPDLQMLSLVNFFGASHGITSSNGAGIAYYSTNNLWTGTDTFSYVVTDTLGGKATGTVSVIITPDLTPPAVATASSFLFSNLVLVVFNESVEAGDGSNGAESLLNYSLPGFTLLSARLQSDNRTVQLAVNPGLLTNTTYHLTARNIHDRAPVPNLMDSQPINVQHFRYYPGVAWDFYTDCSNNVPTFMELTPARSGITTNFNLGMQGTTNNYFAVRFRAILNVTVADTYTFSTASDDGSILWIGTNLVVNNDGVHGTTTKSGTTNLAAGLYPVTVGYFQNTGSHGVQVTWRGLYFTNQIIPAGLLFNDIGPLSPATPAAPTGFTASAIHTGQINLAWIDGAANEMGYTIAQSTNDTTWTLIEFTASNATNFAATGLAPGITYQHQITGVNAAGSSLPATATATTIAAYTWWRLTQFGTNAANPAIAGDFANPTGDGLVNLLKYALGFDPLIPHSGAVPHMLATNGYMTITFPQSKTATDVKLVVEGANTLTNAEWSTNGFVEIDRVDNGSNWIVTVRDGVPISDATNRFLWLHISR